MVTLKTKYIILIWIIILILFTFYCIFRLGYLREKYDNVLIQAQPDIISYVNNIQSQSDITDMPGCSDVYDDNFTVQALGYNTCQSAYNDYLAKNLDVNAKYGQTKSLIDICPVSAKSPKYGRCLQSLMSTFTDNANILNTINADMTTSINKRIDDRNTSISGIQTTINPFIYSKSQVDFSKNMQMNGQVANYKDETLGLVNQYYQNRYRGGFEGFSDVAPDIPSDLSTLILDPQLIDNFFGTYQIIQGQYTALNNLIMTLGYDTPSNNLIPAITVNNITEELPQPILLTIDTGSLKINYTVNYLENYKALPNAIKLNLTNQNIVTDTNINTSQYQAVIQQLLSTLGINIPARLIMIYEEFTSPENIKHRTYKLANDNLDTIVILNKF